MDANIADVSVQWAEGSGVWNLAHSSPLSSLVSEIAKSNGISESSVTLLYHNEPIYELSVPLETFLRPGAKTIYLDALISSETPSIQSQTLDLESCIRANGVLAASNLSLTSDVVPELLKCIQADSHRIYVLELSSNFLGDSGVKQLLPSLAKIQIFSLDLSYNYLSDASLTTIVQLLRVNRTLASINLRGNDFTQPTLSGALESLLESNSVISLIDIEPQLLSLQIRSKFDGLGRLHAARTRRQNLLTRITNADGVASVHEMLVAGVDTWTLLDDGGTLLHYAIQQNACKIVQRLLKEPGVVARIYWKTPDGLSPLELAFRLNCQGIAKALILDGGASIDSLDSYSINKMKDLFVEALGEMCSRHDEAAGAFARQLFLQPSVAASLTSPEWSSLLTQCAKSAPEPPKELRLSFQSLVANECLSALDRCDSLAAEGNRNAQVLYGICALMLETTSERSEAYLKKTSDVHPILSAVSSLFQPLAKSHAFPSSICVLLCDCSSYPRAWRQRAEDIIAGALAPPPSQPPVPSEASKNSRPLTIEDRFEEIKRKYPSQAAALADLMKLTGLISVKEKMLALFDELEVLKLQSSNRRKNMNARFEGNPGTGKTTVVDFYAKILQSTDVLSRQALIERTTGTKLKIQGMMALQDTLKKMKDAGGGLLFIDEAHQLEPATDNEGKKIFWTIMDEMTSNPGKFFVVIAGYQKDIEKLITIDPGFPERFGQRFVFEDYTDEELTKIYTSVIQKEKFKVTDAKWIRIAARRIGQRRGTVGFANARAVQNSFDAALERMRSRLVDERRRGVQSDAHLLIRDDLLGPKATKESLLQGCDAYKELQKLRGLVSVKQSIENIIKAAVENSDLEDNEQPLNQRLNLNRVFLGNPGTGKTTVAKLFAQIVSKLGFLSKGEVVFKTASDFNGSVLGESAKVTLQILDSAKGNVLVIDEAYGLNPKSGFSSSDPYKVAVIDTMVEKIQVGEDIAVILLGYKDKMEQMLLRDSNEGLARRFNMSEAFQFEDYNDDDLFSILQAKSKSKGIKVGLEAAREAVAFLAAQRRFPNFGNAGAVQNLLDNAILRMQSRLRASGVSIVGGQPRELLKIDFVPPNDAEPPTDEELGPDLSKIRSSWTNAIANAKRRGTEFVEDLNFLFTGPPGTGKTTTARLVGRMLRCLELLLSEEVIETSVDDFVTGYAQQAAIRTEEIFNKALGRVLFIDEAYGLEKYPEVADKITALLTDKRFKGKIAVVLAGYENDIMRMLQTNPGLPSRFPFTSRIPFHPWGIDKSLRTLVKVLEEESISVSDAALSYLRKNLPELMCDELQWSSGRDVVTLSRAFRASLELSVDEVGEHHVEQELSKFLQQRKAEARVRSDQRKIPTSVPFMEAPIIGAPAQASSAPVIKIEQRIEEVQDDDGSSGANIGIKQESPVWNGMDIQTELIPLNTALEKLGWDGEDKVNELTNSDPDSDNVAPLLIELTKAGMVVDAAKAVVKKWIDAAEKVRQQRHDAEVEARLRARKPIVQCQVCRRTANFWAPCYVAPMLIGYEEVDLPQHKQLKPL